MTGAKIVIGYTARTRGCRFDVMFEPPIDLPAASGSAEQLQSDVLALNDRIERVIDAHLDQWYFLDNTF